MERTIDIENNPEQLNEWVLRSINLFKDTNYLDQILEVYPFQIASPERLEPSVRRRIINAHQSRRTNELIEILKSLTKFPYEDPIWYLLKNIEGCNINNPAQIQRIANSLYSMTAEETVVRLESAPKLNTQMGPMFNAWLRQRFTLLPLNLFQESSNGICILDSSEEIGKRYINEILNQNLDKRPDLIAKVNNQLIIGEAKWIGQPGGNQEKQVQEVLKFCRNQRGDVIRIGVVDGFPWSLYNVNHRLVNNKEAVNIQESEYDIVSAILLEEYFNQFLNP
ncbi:hypothetical protein [Empedobacter falsenii]|uniref:hypothetical protein n=1 Tax=Empedobacter falsenii TaxID=343874 RepID=UPI001C5A27BD|nr:hypothetical protein [Empedobacter falsenii]MBW1619640.1 hypothetical protein [Empedobacter falsenii]